MVRINQMYYNLHITVIFYFHCYVFSIRNYNVYAHQEKKDANM